MNIVIIINENNDNEWVKIDKEGGWFIVYHYVNNEVESACRYDDFYAAVETLKEWESYFE